MDINFFQKYLTLITDANDQNHRLISPKSVEYSPNLPVAQNHFRGQMVAGTFEPLIYTKTKYNNMKLLRAIFLVGVVLTALASCDKDNGNSAIIGTWEGHWGFDFDNPTYYEKWEIKKGGEMSVFNSNGGKVADGHWEVNGFNFEAQYTTVTSHNTYLFSGLYSDVAGEITGNWGEAPSHADGGTFIMHKN